MFPDRILPINDPRLRRPSEPVAKIDTDTRALAAHMFRIMDAAHGAGLAAVQLGILRRLIVVDVEDGRGARHRLALANPEIAEAGSGQIAGLEGCLSMPGISQRVARSETVTVRYTGLDGHRVSLVADGMLAVCLQHEIDHTNGIVFIDRMSRLRRDQARRQYARNLRLASRRDRSSESAMQ